LKLVADPYQTADRADAIVLMTEWPDYLALDLDEVRSRMRGQLVIDGRNLLDPAAVEAAGLSYQGIGRNTRTPASLTV
jgi:UDPglucose 6-dehydrogenase